MNTIYYADFSIRASFAVRYLEFFIHSRYIFPVPEKFNIEIASWEIPEEFVRTLKRVVVEWSNQTNWERKVYFVAQHEIHQMVEIISLEIDE